MKKISLHETIKHLSGLSSLQQIDALKLLSKTTAIEFPEEAVQAVAENFAPKSEITLADIEAFEKKFEQHITGKTVESNLQAFEKELEKYISK